MVSASAETSLCKVVTQQEKYSGEVVSELIALRLRGRDSVL